jgi:hypothetical protein
LWDHECSPTGMIFAQLENSTPSESAATNIRGVVGKAVYACKNLALNHAAFGPILLTLIGLQVQLHSNC